MTQLWAGSKAIVVFGRFVVTANETIIGFECSYMAADYTNKFQFSNAPTLRNGNGTNEQTNKQAD